MHEEGLLKGVFSDEAWEGLKEKWETASGIASVEEEQDPSELIDKAAELQKKWKVERGQIWEIGKHRLMCGDCVEIMKEWPDATFDAVVTDPPYGMKYHKDELRNLVTGDSEYPLEALTECFRIANGFVLSFCRWNNLITLPQPKSFVACVKSGFTAGDLEYEYGRQWEAAAFWPLSKHRFISRTGDVVSFNRVLAADASHPTEKPASLLAELIGHHYGSRIVDPFIGSGTTMVACQQLRRVCYGIEIEEKFCSVTLERMSALGLEPKLVNG